MRREVLQRRYQVLPILKRAIALESANRSHTQPGNEVRILAESLLDTAPSWISRNVHHGGECLMCAATTSLFCRH